MIQEAAGFDIIYLIITSVGALAALTGAVASVWLVRRHKKGDYPTVIFNLSPSDVGVGWYRIVIKIENTTPVSWKCDRLTLLSPKGAGLLSERDAETQDSIGGHQVTEDTLAPKRTARTVEMGLEVAPSGRNPQTSIKIMGTSDRGFEAFFRVGARSRQIAQIIPPIQSPLDGTGTTPQEDLHKTDAS